MKKRAAALLACLLLLLQPAAVPGARAAESVYFVAVGSNVLPLSDSTMPFWSGGYLYISSSIFTGRVWDSLGISHVAANASQPLILYSGGDRSLIFDPDKPYAQDAAGNTYYPGGVMRHGTVFVPASLVASFFGLQYSLVPNVAHGYLVWLRQPGYGLTDKEFAEAATYPMAECYAQYLKDKTAAQQPNEEEETPQETPEESAPEGGTAYLCLRAGEDTAELLDVLDRSGTRAAFFCSLEILETQGDLLRRMTAQGHAVGILTDASDPRRTPLEQAEEGNEALCRATCQKSRLVYVENGDAEDLQRLEAEGFRCLYPDVDRTESGLRSTAAAQALVQRVAGRSGGVTVWLDESASAGGIQAFLSAAAAAQVRVLPLRETA